MPMNTKDVFRLAAETGLTNVGAARFLTQADWDYEAALKAAAIPPTLAQFEESYDNHRAKAAQHALETTFGRPVEIETTFKGCRIRVGALESFGPTLLDAARNLFRSTL